MLDSIRITNASGDNLVLPLMDVSGGYVIQDIEGLDPVQANIVSSGFALLDGEYYQFARREKRNIIFKIGLKPDYSSMTVQDLRRNLLKFMMPKKAMTTILSFDDDSVPWAIDGRVETFDCPIFTDDPVATISVLNFDPDFQDTVGSSVDLITKNGLIYDTVQYDGDVDTGFLATITMANAATSLTCTVLHPDNTSSVIGYNKALAVGDVLKISTVPGNKFVKLTHNGVEASGLQGVPPGSSWPTLMPGLNKVCFQVNLTSTGGDAVHIDYTTRHGSV